MDLLYNGVEFRFKIRQVQHIFYFISLVDFVDQCIHALNFFLKHREALPVL
jgi:hypothetical protein